MTLEEASWDDEELAANTQFAGYRVGFELMHYQECLTESGQRDQARGDGIGKGRTGGLPQFPVDVLIAFDDATTQRQVWDGQAISQTLTFDTRAPLAYAVLDPEKKFAMEVNTTDNSLTVQPEVTPLVRLASRWLFWMQAILDWGF